jgi:hypothetical protein
LLEAAPVSIYFAVVTQLTILGGNAMGQYFSRTIAVSEIAMIDPSPKIAYQPGFSLIGAGLMDPKEVSNEWL